MRRVFGRTYLFQKSLWAFLVGIIDSIGFFLRTPSKKVKWPDHIEKILVSRIDHLGDVLLALSMMPFLKKVQPFAEIHFLVGEWANELVQRNPYVDKVLNYNSFVHSRKGSIIKRLWGDIRSFLNARKELKREHYDLGLVLRANPFNSILLMHLGCVKYTVGFTTGGFGFLLDQTIPFMHGVHETENLKALLNQLWFSNKGNSLSPSFYISDDARHGADEVLKNVGLTHEDSFVFFHLGSANPKKRWNIKQWQSLTDSMIRRWGVKVLAYDSEWALSNCLKLPSLLPLDVLAEVMERAMLFVGHDSFPAHLAPAVNTPAVVIWCGISDYVQFSQTGNAIWLVRKDIDCAPCYKRNGCRTMDCMRISMPEVMKGVEMLMLNQGVVDHTMRSLVRRGTCFGYQR